MTLKICGGNLTHLKKKKQNTGVQISDGEKGGRREGVRTQHVIRQSG